MTEAIKVQLGATIVTRNERGRVVKREKVVRKEFCPSSKRTKVHLNYGCYENFAEVEIA